MSPPSAVIEAAVRAARESPCIKSQRGVVVYGRMNGIDIASGYNGPPGRNGTCAEDAACRESCGKLCVHAEVRALRHALIFIKRPEYQVMSMSELDAVHVKLGPDRGLVGGGGPSCWQCSREVLDVGLGGFWLYEAVQCRCDMLSACMRHTEPAIDDCPCELHDNPGKGVWRRYTAVEFHAATLAARSLPPMVTR